MHSLYFIIQILRSFLPFRFFLTIFRLHFFSHSTSRLLYSVSHILFFVVVVSIAKVDNFHSFFLWTFVFHFFRFHLRMLFDWTIWILSSHTQKTHTCTHAYYLIKKILFSFFWFYFFNFIFLFCSMNEMSFDLLICFPFCCATTHTPFLHFISVVV